MSQSPVVLLVVQVILTVVAANDECQHALESVAKNHLVDTDALQFYNGVFANLWVQASILETTKCSYSKYSLLQDGSVKEESFMRDLEGNKNTFGKEVIEKTDTKGLLKVSGFDENFQKYSGKTYVFYADQYVLGFYQCLIGGPVWNMGIQVKTKDGLQSATPTPVKESVQNAKAIMEEILKGTSSDKVKMVQYDVGKLCFD